MNEVGNLTAADVTSLVGALGASCSAVKIAERLAILGLGAQQVPGLERADIHEWFEDFHLPFNYATQYTVYTVEAGAGDATEAVQDAARGMLKLLNDDADDDADQIVGVNEQFKLAAGKKLYAEFGNVTFSEATQMDWAVGLIAKEDLKAVADNMPADGVVIKKDDGDTNIDVASSKNGTNDLATIGTADTSEHTYALYFDGAGHIKSYIDGAYKDTRQTTICDDEELTPTLLIRNGDANARNILIDYILVRQER